MLLTASRKAAQVGSNIFQTTGILSSGAAGSSWLLDYHMRLNYRTGDANIEIETGKKNTERIFGEGILHQMLQPQS